MSNKDQYKNICLFMIEKNQVVICKLPLKRKKKILVNDINAIVFFLKKDVYFKIQKKDDGLIVDKYVI